MSPIWEINMGWRRLIQKRVLSEEVCAQIAVWGDRISCHTGTEETRPPTWHFSHSDQNFILWQKQPGYRFALPLYQMMTPDAYTPFDGGLLERSWRLQICFQLAFQSTSTPYPILHTTFYTRMMIMMQESHHSIILVGAAVSAASR